MKILARIFPCKFPHLYAEESKLANSKLRNILYCKSDAPEMRKPG
jgi:hypothetical protein